MPEAPQKTEPESSQRLNLGRAFWFLPVTALSRAYSQCRIHRLFGVTNPDFAGDQFGEEQVAQEFRGKIRAVVPNDGVHVHAERMKRFKIEQFLEDGAVVVINGFPQVHHTFHAVAEPDINPVLSCVVSLRDPVHGFLSLALYPLLYPPFRILHPDCAGDQFGKKQQVVELGESLGFLSVYLDLCEAGSNK